MSNTILAAIAAIGLIVGTVSIIATWRSTRTSTSAQVYRDAAQAWEAKSKAQDAELADLRQKLILSEHQISDLTQRVSILQDMVTSRTLIEQQSAVISAHHAELMTKVAEVLGLAGDIRGDVRKLAIAGDKR